MINMLMGLVMVIMTTASPTIESVKGGKFLITYDKGAVWSCTVYQEQVKRASDSNFPDGMYAPRHCWGLDADTTGYVDDWAYITKSGQKWKVWAEVQYEVGNELKVVKSNQVEVIW